MQDATRSNGRKCDSKVLFIIELSHFGELVEGCFDFGYVLSFGCPTFMNLADAFIQRHVLLTYRNHDILSNQRRDWLIMLFKLQTVKSVANMDLTEYLILEMYLLQCGGYSNE